MCKVWLRDGTTSKGLKCLIFLKPLHDTGTLCYTHLQNSFRFCVLGVISEPLLSLPLEQIRVESRSGMGLK